MNAEQLFEIWIGMYVFDLLRYLIPVSFAFLLFWVVGKKRWRHRFIQSTFPKNKQLWKEVAYSMCTVVIFSLIGLGVFMMEQAGWTRIYHQLSDFGILYLFGSLFFAMVFHDFYFYWTHRFMHHKRFFKYIHKVHHESTNPSPWAAYSFHPWEAIIQALIVPILVVLIPMHHLTLFIFLAYMIIRNVMGHLGFEIWPKGFTKSKWFGWNTAVTHHNMHHEHFHCNYGLYFSWWDRLMKTEHKKYHEVFEEVKQRPRIESKQTITKESLTIMSWIFLCSFALQAQSIEGRWITYNEVTGTPLSEVEIIKTASGIEGKVARIYVEPNQGEDPICTKCDGERKNQKIVNMNILWGFHPGKNEHANGKILDPNNGETYHSKIWLEDANTLNVRGYDGTLQLFYRTQTWRREVPAKERKLTGTWLSYDDTYNKVKSRIEIVESNGELKGYIRTIFLLPNEGPDPVCTACEGPLKNNKIVGMKILSGFKKVGDTWEDGKILDPGNGNTYTCSMWLLDERTLKVRGYLGPFFRTQVWKKM